MNARADHQAALGPLLDAAASGDGTAWDTLVARFTGLLWATARAHRLSPADSADVVQTTWLRLVENLGRIEDPERLGGWLATTARRECLLVLRRSHREPPVPTDEVFDHIPDPRSSLDSALLASERDASLWRMFDELPDRCRRLLRILVADPPLTYSDISHALDIPIGSIGPTRQRCLSQLRSLALDTGVLDPEDAALDLTQPGSRSAPTQGGAR
jgi:RNA polymerase sigma factor (sigma-70 family)